MVKKSKENKGIYQRKNGTFYFRFKRILEDGKVIYIHQSGFSSEGEAVKAMEVEKRKFNPKKCDLRRKAILFDDLLFDLVERGVSETSKAKYLSIYNARLKQFKGRQFMDISDEEMDNFLDSLKGKFADSYINSIRKLNNLLIKWYVRFLDYDLELQNNIKLVFENTEFNEKQIDTIEDNIRKNICKVDFNEKNRENKEVGLMSELFVIKFLEYQGITGIHHTSRIDGDGAGYDIEVHNSKCDFYIEVKGTKGKANNDIMLTSNEIETLKLLGTKGNIYRVYNLSYDKSKVCLLDTDREKELLDSLDGEIIFTNIFEIEKNLEPICYKCKIV